MKNAIRVIVRGEPQADRGVQTAGKAQAVDPGTSRSLPLLRSEGDAPEAHRLRDEWNKKSDTKTFVVDYCI